MPETSGGMPVVELRTGVPGLVLRRLAGSDVDAYIALVRANEDHLTRHGDYRDLYPVEPSSVLQELRRPDHLAFGVWLHASLIGRVDLVPREDGNVVLGYWLEGKQSGHGYATAACVALIEYGRSELGVTDVWAGVTKGNVASEGVLQRLGFERVADMGNYTRFHLALT
jgi:RimJ/RimL family protein N-acetyltransferase